MLLLFLMLICFYLAVDGNHFLIEISDNSKEAGSGSEADYEEPGCIELPTDFSVSCVTVKNGRKFSVSLVLITVFCTGRLTNQTVLRGKLWVECCWVEWSVSKRYGCTTVPYHCSTEYTLS